MPYCVKQDLIDRFGETELIELTDRADAGVIDDTVLDQAIADASAEIDSYLAGRYTLPLASTPLILERLACDMSRYYLHDEAATEQVNKRYDAAVRTLRMIAGGKITLGLAVDGSEPVADSGAEMESGGRVFGRGSSGFI